MALSKTDRETLEQNWGKAREEVARQLPNVAPANLGNIVQPERIAMLSGQDQDRVDEVLSDVAKQLKKDQSEDEKNSDKPIEQVAADKAQQARVAAGKADEERMAEVRAADEKAMADRAARLAPSTATRP